MLESAAWHAFFNWNDSKVQTLVNKALKHTHDLAKLPAAFPDKLLYLIMVLLGKDELAAAEILEQRVVLYNEALTEYDAVVCDDSFGEFLPTSDLKQWDKHKDDQVSNKTEVARVRDAVLKLVRSHYKVIRPDTPTRIIVKTFPIDDDEFSDDFVRSLFPPDKSIRVQRCTDNRWRVYFTMAAGNKTSKSASWGNRGSHAACVQFLMDTVWPEYEAKGFVCPFREDIVAAAPAAAAADAAAEAPA